METEDSAVRGYVLLRRRSDPPLPKRNSGPIQTGRLNAIWALFGSPFKTRISR